MEPKVSFCLIVKNEEKYIETCLKSLLPVAYEIIVVDTGSSDKTKEIIKGFVGTEQCSVPTKPQVKVFDFKWQDDYSKARNESIKHVTGDWIFIINADEELTEQTQKHLIPFLKEQPYINQPVAFSLKVIEPQADSVSMVFKTLLFKSGFDIHFIRPIHEHICREQNDLIIAKADFLTLFHSGNKIRSKEELKKKTEKYIFKLVKLTRETPDPKDNYFFYYHLGNAYSNVEQYNNAIKAYHDSYSNFNKTFSEKKSQFYGNILISLIRTMTFCRKKYKEALPYIDELLNISPNFPDAIFYQGYCYQYLGDYLKAIETYKYLLNLFNTNLENLDPIGINSLHYYLNFMLMQELGRCYFITKDMHNALSFFNRAYSKNKKSFETCILLTLFYLLNNNVEQAIIYYFQVNTSIPDTEKERLISISKLSYNDIRVINLISDTLKNIENTNIEWLKEEIKLIRNKIKELNSFLPKLSVCIISKNQENYIETCLKSILPVAYEIIIIDTGSTDQTRDIAAMYGKVFETKNEINDFRLRNHMLQYITGEYVLFLNGDEELTTDTQNNLLMFLKEQPYQDKASGFYLECVNKSINESYFKGSLFKTGFEIKYNENDELVSEKQKLTVVITSFTISQNQDSSLTGFPKVT